MVNHHDTWDISMAQLCDSMFPAGTYTLSNGIEYMHRSGTVQTASDLLDLIETYVLNQAGPGDGAITAAAHKYCQDGDIAAIRLLDAHTLAMKSVREGRVASARSGTQLVRCVAGFVDDTMIDAYLDDIRQKRAGGAYPVAFGICCHTMGIPQKKAVTALLYGFVAGNVGAALRLGIIQHFEGQKIIHRTKHTIRKAAAKSCNTDIFWQFCPQAEIAQMSHERMDEKMFIT